MFSCFKKKKSNPSAFRAVSADNRPVTANESTKVFFELEEYDLNGEYQADRSVFIPKEDGIYVIVGEFAFLPQNYNENYRARIEFKVNGELSLGGDNDFWGTGVTNTNAVEATSIIKLKAGEKLEVFMQSSIEGFIVQNAPGLNTTSFSAFRVAEL